MDGHRNGGSPDCFEARRGIDVHFTTFQDLLALAATFLDKHDYEAAAMCGQIAADYAWNNHPGIFASRQLEAILLTIGKRIFKHSGVPHERSPRPVGVAHRLLHVLTSAYGIGGHTRLAWRWIQEDSDRIHSVALTDQRSAEIPQQLAEAVSAARGEVQVLDAKPHSLLTKAKMLRNAAASADIVILHIHPYDVVPLIALADKQHSSPVMFSNHADHLFWLGVGISDIVVNFRDSGAALAQARRGVEAERCRLLPLPLPLTQRTYSREEAKKHLGLQGDSVLLLSVASAYKYTPIDHVNFIDAIVPVLNRHERSVLMVVGPDGGGLWRTAQDRTGGRILPVGVQQHIAPMYQAADIYVDSFPFCSITSLLEAGSYGVPLVTYCGHPDSAAVLCADCPGLSRSAMRTTTIEEFRAILSRLIEKPELRTSIGTRAQDEISSLHHGAYWTDMLPDLYRSAMAVSRISVVPDGGDEKIVSELDVLLACLQIRSGSACGLKSIAEVHLDPAWSLPRGLFPRSRQVRGWIRALRRNRSLGLVLLESGWLGARGKRWCPWIERWFGG
jgi:hypothetical protein